MKWILLVAALVVAAFGWMKWRESRRFFDVPVLLSRFPVEDAAVLRIDAAALRAGGFLTASKLPLESEYKQFLDGTGFDYHRDLDSVVASFSKSGNFFIARGHFDWNKLRAYAVRQGGSCYKDLCRLQGSTPERHISFLPLRDDAIALAVSMDDLAASRLTKAAQPITAKLPDSPVWVSIPGSQLRQPGALPQGIRVVFSGLINAERVVIMFTGSEAHLEASCRTQGDAGILASQLRSSASLASGKIDQNGLRVEGRWPVGKDLFDSLIGGI